jgi:norsolorinic acid ketoreductase
MMDDVNYKVAEVSLENVEKHFKINTVASLALFQACLPLIPKGGKFIFMSSGASVLDRVPDKTDACYGVTKCAVNFLARYAAAENPDIIIFPLSPGWVQTDMGNRGASYVGMKQAPLTVDQSVGE